ncbi:MAG: precorrin-8X methylmutase [Proteobacteria bacterium]|nr:precorrin-8X methylmutase [Pseudomonadota bacterium]
MKTELRSVKPGEIEAESFRIIEQELGDHAFDPQTFAVVRRVIHATGDFGFADHLRFGNQAVRAGIAAIRAGRNILTDVNMVAAGINKTALAAFGGRVICKLADPGVAAAAAESGRTRSEVAIEQGLAENIGIVAIGNAPTALLKVMELIGRSAAGPDLVVGVPVGFVNAAESKEILSRQDYPLITVLGRKGGSPVAAAIVNALSRLAREE